jgi:hypothetical protein
VLASPSAPDDPSGSRLASVLLACAALLAGLAPRARAQEGGVTRHYSLAAEDVLRDFAPSRKSVA